MNCTAIRKRLLACEQPDFPPPEVRDHLTDCADCRALQQRVVQIERQITELPVPASEGRASFVLRFLAGDEAFRPLHPSPGLRHKENGRLKAAVAFALAAGLAAFALGWWAWPQAEPVAVNDKGGPIAVSRFPDRPAQLRSLLETARTPAEKVRRLTALAEQLQEEARTSHADTEKLSEVAHFCAQVVREHLLQYARTVPRAERAALLPDVAERLEKIESKALRLATEMKAQGAASAEASYRDIAAATRDTYGSLRKLAHGEVA
jgi:hypothetical protein